MGTFQQWLSEQTGRPQTDPVGWLARYWDSFRDTRPRRSSPDSIERWLVDNAPDEATQHAVTTAVAEAKVAYRKRDEPAAGETPRELTQAEQAAFSEMNAPHPLDADPPRPLSGIEAERAHQAGLHPAEPTGSQQAAQEIAQQHGWVSGSMAGRSAGTSEPGTLADGHTDGDGCIRMTGSSADDLPRIAAHFGVPPRPDPADALDQLSRELLQRSAEAAARSERAVELAALTLRLVTRIARHMGVTAEMLDAEMSLAGQLAAPAAAPEPIDMTGQLYGQALQPDPTPPGEQAAEFARWWGTLGQQGG